MALGQDLCRSFRAFRTHPVLTAMAVVMLALGIGASTVMFSAVDAVLLRPLPYGDGDRLVWVWSMDARRSLQQWTSFPDFLDWRARTRTLEHLAGWGTYELTLTGRSDPQRIQALLVSADFFELLGVPPLVGTTDDSGDQRVVLSHALWQRSFDGDPSLVGGGVTLAGTRYTVTGVMPPAFRFPIESPADLWMIVRDDQFNPALRDRRDARLIEVIARLRPGVTVEQAQADMDAIASDLQREYPSTNADTAIRVVPAIRQIAGSVATAMWVLFAAVACVLLIACANVANLLMARTVRRRTELAVRAALGAGRARILRELMIESLPLGIAGGALGGLLSIWGVRALTTIAPAQLPRADGIAVDLRALAFTAAASLVSVLVVGLSPAWRASNVAPGPGLRMTSGLASFGGSTRRLPGLLVTAQIAVAMMLLAGAALLGTSFARLTRDDPGYDPRNVLTFRLDWPTAKYRPGEAAQKFRELQERLEAVPGVQVASIGLQLPDRGRPLLDRDLPLIEVAGQPIARGQRLRTAVLTVQPGYFRALGIPLLRGRDFDAAYGPDDPPVVIVNEAVARAYFGDANPVGRRLLLDGWSSFDRRPAEIVGVAGNVSHRHLRGTASPLVYVPLTQDPVNGASVVVKTAGDPLQLAGAVRDVVRSIDPDQPIDELQTLDERLAGALAQDRFSALVIGVCAIAALVLAAGGLYGLLSYAVAQRTREVGIRVALGAGTRDVVGLVLRDGMRLTAMGMAAGAAGALLAARAIDRLLFGIGASDPFTYAVAALFLAAVAAAACLMPVRQALRVDPVVAIKSLQP